MSIYRRILYYFCTTCRPNRSRTVRFAFPVVLGAIAILGAVAVTSKNQSFIEIVPSDTNVRAGQSLTLDVYVNAHKPINAVDLYIDIPKSQLKVTNIETGRSVITLWTVEPYVKGDTVVLRGGTFRRGFVGRHLIATINAQAVQTGIAYVDTSDSLLLAGDGSATEIQATEIGKDNVKLYIADKSGNFTALDGLEPGTFEGSAEVRIVTDIDGDGDVSLSDISRFMAAWNSKDVIYDFSGDGKMTFRDFAIILADSFFK